MLELFFQNIMNPWSSSLYEYTVKTIFVHLDDQNEKIQQAVISLLKEAMKIQTDDFIRVG